MQLNRALLRNFHIAARPLSLNELVSMLELPRSAKKRIETAMDMLVRNGEIRKSGKRGYSLVAPDRYSEATLEKHPRGFGFATELQAKHLRKKGEKDPYIPAARMGSARHQDRVLIRLSDRLRNGRPEAEVVWVVKRGRARLAGRFYHESHHGIVVPDDPRYPARITLSKPPLEQINEGDAVLVDLHEEPDGIGSPSGEVVEVLGDPETARVQQAIISSKYDLPLHFGESVEKELHSLAPDPEVKEREDLRDLLHITIDGMDAKDFDDAICIEKQPSGYRLWVSIADVSAFVKKGSSIDKEAYERGTSIYFPGAVIPMLPEKLSNELCSLLPGEDRLTVTARLDYDATGHLQKKKFFRSQIRSKFRFTYDTVAQILTDKDPEVRTAHAPFVTPLEWAADLANQLIERSVNRGALRLSIPEPRVTLDEDNKVHSISKFTPHFAHQIIEAFMLAANEAVAETLVEAKLPTLFRVHEEPDPEKAAEFTRFASTLGLDLPHYRNDPSWYAEVIELVRNTTHEYMMNGLLLRTMQQARYSPRNHGHFGLAARSYVHFTSPIRRYPDLLIHRQLCSLIARKTKTEPTAAASLRLKAAGLLLSSRERRAINAEREMTERLKALYLSTRIGEQFDALISGVSESSLYIELTDTYISGIIRLSSLKDDYYLFDEKRYRVVGDVGRKVFTVGDELEVELIEVDIHNYKSFFQPV